MKQLLLAFTVLLCSVSASAQIFTNMAVVGPATSPGANYGVSCATVTATVPCDIMVTLPAAFVIHSIAFEVVTKTGTPTWAAQIQTDLNGRPSGTACGTGVAGQATPASGAATGDVALGGDCSGTASTTYHLLIWMDGSSTSFTVRAQNGTGLAPGGLSAISSYNPQMAIASATGCSALPAMTGCSWTTSQSGPVFMLKNAAGTLYFGQAFDTANIVTLSATVYQGIVLTARVSGSVVGVVMGTIPNGTSATLLKIYSGCASTGGSIVATATLDPSWSKIYTGRQTSVFTFDAGPYAVTAGTCYRFVLLDSTATNRFDYIEISVAAYKSQDPLTVDWKFTSGTTSAWTDTAGKLPALFQLIYSSITAGSGGASGGSGFVY